jgi:hypothetical protein
MKLKVGKYYSLGDSLALQLMSLSKTKLKFRVLQKPEGSILTKGGTMTLEKVMLRFIESKLKEVPKLKAQLLYED